MVRVACHVSYVQNHTSYDKIGWATTIEVRDGYTPDVILLTEFKFGMRYIIMRMKMKTLKRHMENG